MNVREAKRHLVLSGIVLAIAELDNPLNSHWRTEDCAEHLLMSREISRARALRAVDHQKFAAWLKRRALAAAEAELRNELSTRADTEHAWTVTSLVVLCADTGAGHDESDVDPVTLLDVLPADTEPDLAESDVEPKRELEERVLCKVTPCQRRLLDAWRVTLERNPQSTLADAARQLGISPTTARRHLQSILQQVKAGS